MLGLGAAVVQAVLPGIIKRQFPRHVGVVMGLYSSMLMAGGALGAQLSPLAPPPAATGFIGLAWMAVPALLALALAARSLPPDEAVRSGRMAAATYLARPRVWLLMACFGRSTAAIRRWWRGWRRSIRSGLERGGQRQPARGPDGMPGGRGVAAAGAGSQARGPPALAVADPGPAGGGFRRPGVAAGRGAHRLGHAAGSRTGRLLRPVADRGAGPSAGSLRAGVLSSYVQGRRLPDRGGAALDRGGVARGHRGFRDGWLLHLACVAVVAALYLQAAPSSYARRWPRRADAARAGSGGS